MMRLVGVSVCTYPELTADRQTGSRFQGYNSALFFLVGISNTSIDSRYHFGCSRGN